MEHLPLATRQSSREDGSLYWYATLAEAERAIKVATARGDFAQRAPHRDTYDDGFAILVMTNLHGYTCGVCRWGRDSLHGFEAYVNHMKYKHSEYCIPHAHIHRSPHLGCMLR